MSAALARAPWRSALRLRGIMYRGVHDGFSALNVYKDPAKAPVEKPDSEYPSWLWTITEPGLTREELLREAQGHYAEGGFDQVFEQMPEKKLKRLFKLDATARIKANNERRRGGRVI